MISEFTTEEEKVLLRKRIISLSGDPRLTQWEADFLASISSQILITKLSVKQKCALNKIFQKYLKK